MIMARKNWAMPPSMRLVVKPHSGILSFFHRSADRPRSRSGILPSRPCLLLLSILSPPPHSPHPRRGEGGGGESMLLLVRMRPRPGSLLALAIVSAGVIYGPSATPGQPSLRVTPATAPTPATLYARCVPDATSKVHPSNERCPCRSPGGRTATLSDWLRCFDPFAYASGSDRFTHSAAAAACFACRRAVEFTFQRPSFSWAPSSSSPWSTKRHSAINSLHASATMPTWRARLLPGPKRRSYHWRNALVGCQRNHSHASSTIKQRTCLLPALLMPCSRWLLPLS